jgi:hypothetical protein
MNDILNEIKEILKISPARFSRIYYKAIVEPIGVDNIKVTIISTFNYIISHVDNVTSTTLRNIEKWHSAGLAVGCVEHYLKDKNFEYTTTMSKTSNNELIAEIIIHVQLN